MAMKTNFPSRTKVIAVVLFHTLSAIAFTFALLSPDMSRATSPGYQHYTTSRCGDCRAYKVFRLLKKWMAMSLPKRAKRLVVSCCYQFWAKMVRIKSHHEVFCNWRVSYLPMYEALRQDDV
jgi:hypothetical protein